MKRRKFVLLLFFGRRRGIRLGRTDRESWPSIGRWRPLGAVADWEHGILARDPEARFFRW